MEVEKIVQKMKAHAVDAIARTKCADLVLFTISRREKNEDRDRA